ncbi:DNA (cytosine-5-)-methyltransferase [Faecalicoccus pleomorphus]|uniref:DNA (cytosine-5-)-methyltransferase n=1 Tax=Faecalicoccus pleomorphus TaxID=1323 RepID=UPI003DA4B630
MDQLNIFDVLYENYKIKNKIRLIELFAGVGSQAMALRDLGADFESYRVVEFDKYAIKSYNAIHGTNFPTIDIRDIHCEDLGIVDKQNVTYLLTYSFPCQDLSKAGKQRGMTKGSGTRSGLLWEVERILNECKDKDSLPQVLLMENVPDVIGTKNYEDFMKWYAALENMGYQSYYKVLNAKNYGIPQNRERCFMVSILGGYNYTFPKPIPLKLRLKDMLEESVDDKYYISNSKIESLLTTNFNCSKFENVVQDKYGISSTLCARDYKDTKCVVVGTTSISKYESSNRIYSPKGISLTINTMQGGNLQPKVAVKENTKQGYALATEGDSINLEQPNSKTRRGRIGKQVAQILTTSCNQGVIYFYNHRVKDDDFIGTLTTNCGNVVHCGCFGTKENNDKDGIRIRKLTPKECWRLMGFKDSDFEKAEKVNSNTQLYKQAGNSIVKQVLMAIFKQMID